MTDAGESQPLLNETQRRLLFPLHRKQPSPPPQSQQCGGIAAIVAKVALAMLLFIGTTVGAYLIHQQQRNIWDNTLELVHRDVWLANEAIPRGQLLDASSANSVIVSQTGGPECIDSGRCARLVREMQIVANISTGVDIAFNFLIAGNGQTFEARGWSHRQSAINKSVVPSTTMSGHLLTIAFVGDFSRRPPSELMLRQADALLAIAVQSGRLESDYRAYGAIDGTEIGWVLFDVLAKRWRTRWEMVIDK